MPTSVRDEEVQCSAGFLCSAGMQDASAAGGRALLARGGARDGGPTRPSWQPADHPAGPAATRDPGVCNHKQGSFLMSAARLLPGACPYWHGGSHSIKPCTTRAV
jgi:hypothetical protein